MPQFGYIRVSTKGQNEDRQLAALAPLHIPPRNLYIEKQSGKDFARPAYRRLFARLRPGDILTVQSIDRLGRNYAEIIEQWRAITRGQGADIRVVDMPLLDTTYCKDLLGTFISDLVLSVLSFAAQLERETILRRQADGITAAKARGVRFGRALSPLPADFEDIYRVWRDGGLCADEAAALCGVSKRTLYERTRTRRGQE